MTEAQRNYLADLAGKKGVILSGTDNYSAAMASAKIEELKLLPDKDFNPVSDRQKEKIGRLTDGVLAELNKWGFERGQA